MIAKISIRELSNEKVSKLCLIISIELMTGFKIRKYLTADV